MLLTIKAEVDQETYERLVEDAGDERRPMYRHAGVVLRRGLGLPFPSVIGSNVLNDQTKNAPAEPARTAAIGV